MIINIRQETTRDYASIFELLEEAFLDDPHSDHTEQFMVERIRKSPAFIPQLSLVATHNEEIVGYVLLFKIYIQNQHNKIASLALAPVAVKPGFQRKGIGGQLIERSQNIAYNLGYHSIILLGHEEYYPRFGYELTNRYAIKLPFAVPEINCMIKILDTCKFGNTHGEVVYPKAFFQ